MTLRIRLHRVHCHCVSPPVQASNRVPALWNDDTKLQQYQASRAIKPTIDIYSYAGKKQHSIPWDKGTIKGLGWSDEEQLLVVLADGTVRCYDIQGDFTQFSLGHGSDNYGVHSCRYLLAPHVS